MQVALNRKQNNLEKAIDLAGTAIQVAGKAKQAYDYLNETYHTSFQSKKEVKKQVKKTIEKEIGKEMQRNPYIQPKNNYNPRSRGVRTKRNFNVRDGRRNNRNRRFVNRGRGYYRPINRPVTFNRPRDFRVVRRGARTIQSLGLPGRKVVTGSVNTRIRHKEFISNVSCSSTYTAIPTAVNVGLPGIFPWLNQIAPAFERYRILNIQMIYEKNTGYDDSGTIWMAFIYDPDDIGNSLRYNTPEAISGVTKCEHGDIKDRLVLTLLPNGKVGPTGGTFYVRTGAVADNDEPRWYDPAFFVIATQGDNVTTCGRLYIQYDIVFLDAVPNPSPLCSFLYSTTCDAANPLIGASEYAANTPLVFDITAKTMTFVRDFRGIVLLFVTGTVLVDNSSAYNLVGSLGASVSGFAFPCSGTTTQLGLWTLTAPEGGVLTWSAGVAATVTNARIMCYQMFQTLSPTLPPKFTSMSLKHAFSKNSPELVDRKNFQLINNLMTKLDFGNVQHEEKIDDRLNDEYHDETVSDPGEVSNKNTAKLRFRK